VRQGKRFFFEKKKQKTFIINRLIRYVEPAADGVVRCPRPRNNEPYGRRNPFIIKSFLLLFFKKEALPSLAFTLPT
jgi:hypothetical protein